MLRRVFSGWRQRTRICVALLGTCQGFAGALAAEPAALVEETSNASGTAPPMAYLTEGTQLNLGPQTRLVLDYVASCTREVVVGGNLRVGHAASEVVGGHVTRSKMDCGKIALALPDDQIDQSGVAVARADVRPRGAGSTRTIFSRAPVFRDGLGRAGSLLWIERIDGAAPMVVATLRRRHDGGRGAELDLQHERLSLAVPGRYRATSGTRSVVFEARFEPWMAIWPRLIEF